MDKPVIDVIIPAHNEEKSLGLVIANIPKGLVREVIVCNNASTDRTAQIAHLSGATVLDVPEMGYGNACLEGIAYLQNKPQEEQPDIVVFIDADYSDYPEELPQLIHPIVEEDVDMVIGSRVLGDMERGAMMPQQIFGNWLATNLIRMFYSYHFTDLGPFRAIKFDKLLELEMEDRDFGWTVEMQVKAAKKRLNCREVPVSYRRRIGVSKVSGTVRGSVLAGHKILWTIFKFL
ncbi:MAG TPA: glycosyltransferase family 2 protein [Saprospiraceae bacterium]|nr:glycosyltransferase family 2 protein [Saprospiraceae bacterium]HMP25633.1 glycosyltransferase family 2 protein [Saprospiraceae bacterium]